MVFAVDTRNGLLTQFFRIKNILLTQENSSTFSTFIAGSMTSDLIFEMIPDVSAPNLNTRVCGIDIVQVGENLPCVKSR